MMLPFFVLFISNNYLTFHHIRLFFLGKVFDYVGNGASKTL